MGIFTGDVTNVIETQKRVHHGTRKLRPQANFFPRTKSMHFRDGPAQGWLTNSISLRQRLKRDIGEAPTRTVIIASSCSLALNTRWILLNMTSRAHTCTHTHTASTDAPFSENLWLFCLNDGCSPAGNKGCQFSYCSLFTSGPGIHLHMNTPLARLIIKLHDAT